MAAMAATETSQDIIAMVTGEAAALAVAAVMRLTAAMVPMQKTHQAHLELVAEAAEAAGVDLPMTAARTPKLPEAVAQ